MRRVLFLSLVLLTAGGCTAAINARTTPPSAESLMQADRDFATATHERGIDGWMSFFAADAVRARYRGNFIKGIDSVRAFDLPSRTDTTSVLNWEPTDAYVFRDGRTGSTTGRYVVISRKTADAGKEIGHGRYITMWQRVRGRWLVILDGGYPEP